MAISRIYFRHLALMLVVQSCDFLANFLGSSMSLMVVCPVCTLEAVEAEAEEEEEVEAPSLSLDHKFAWLRLCIGRTGSICKMILAANGNNWINLANSTWCSARKAILAEMALNGQRCSSSSSASNAAE